MAFFFSQIKNRVMQVLNQHGGSPKDIKEIMRGKIEIFVRAFSSDFQDADAAFSFGTTLRYPANPLSLVGALRL